jgi:hypothetical protein
MPAEFYVHEGDPTTPWTGKQGLPENMKGYHYGQLKLFLCDLHTILQYFEINPEKTMNDCVIVYAGAAAGSHIVRLVMMFPEIEWHLYDPVTDAEFDPVLKTMSQKEHQHKVKIFQEAFVDKTTKRYNESKKDIIFLSDIWLRKRQPGNDLQEVMLSQQRWHEQMKSVISCLKFRGPYIEPHKDVSFEYLNGNLLKVPFAPVDSTELRLIVTASDKGMKKYDALFIEQAMAYHNQKMRMHELKHYGAQFCNVIEKRWQQCHQSSFSKTFKLGEFITSCLKTPAAFVSADNNGCRNTFMKTNWKRRKLSTVDHNKERETISEREVAQPMR